MREEAIKRLDYLVEHGLWDEARNYFEKGLPCYSMPVNVLGTLTGVMYTFEETPALKKIVEALEEKYGFKVYYGIYNETGYGKVLALLFVDKNTKTWKNDMLMLKRGRPYAYLYYIDKGCGEIGWIGIKVAAGGLVRTF